MEDSGRACRRGKYCRTDCRTTVGLSDCRTVGLLSDYCRITVGLLSEFTVGLSDRGSGLDAQFVSLCGTRAHARGLPRCDMVSIETSTTVLSGAVPEAGGRGGRRMVG